MYLLFSRKKGDNIYRFNLLYGRSEAFLLTGTVDVHVDGFVVALRLEIEQLGDHQTGHGVIDLREEERRQRKII